MFWEGLVDLSRLYSNTELFFLKPLDKGCSCLEKDLLLERALCAVLGLFCLIDVELLLLLLVNERCDDEDDERNECFWEDNEIWFLLLLLVILLSKLIIRKGMRYFIGSFNMRIGWFVL